MTDNQDIADFEIRDHIREILAPIKGINVISLKQKDFLNTKSAWELRVTEPNFYTNFKVVFSSLGKSQSSIRIIAKMIFGDHWYQSFDPQTKVYSPFHSILQLEALRKGVTFLALPASETEKHRITGCILEDYIFKEQITKDRLLDAFKNMFDAVRVTQITMQSSGIMQNGNGDLEIDVEDKNGHRTYS